MSLPILIKPLSFRLGLFYYFRFALKSSKLYIAIILFLFFFIEQYQAQVVDSLGRISNEYDSLLRSDATGIDRLFYKHYNDVLINNIGSYGSAYYIPTSYSLYEKDLLKINDPLKIKFFGLEGVKPFTNISYLNASRKEQVFSIKHIQQFGKQLSLNFDLHKVSSPGVYVNQESNNTLFEGEITFKSNNNIYSIVFKNEIQRDFFQLNGGLLNIDSYESSLYDDERVYNVNLSTSNSYLKRYNYDLTQQIDLFSLNNDTSILSKIYIKHNLNYESKNSVFFDNDPTSNIYSSILIDSVSTVDSIYTNNLSNTGFIGFHNSNLFFEVFYQSDYINYFQRYGLDTNYTNNYIGISSGFNFNLNRVESIIKYGISGYRTKDVLSDIKLTKNKKKYNIELEAGYFLTEADLKYVNYTSNHYEWKNYDFEKQSILDLKLSFEWKKAQLQFSGETKLITNILFYDTLAEANQFAETVSISTLSISKKYKLFNFHFRSALIYQSTSDKTILPLPELIARQIAYYQKHIFKGALKIQLGLGVSYSTEYYGYAFMPALSEFYVQENKKIGYYPNIDVFLNTHLKRAQIFLKYEHINSGGSLEKAYAVPDYPLLNKSLKFGISWNLFD